MTVFWRHLRIHILLVLFLQRTLMPMASFITIRIFRIPRKSVFLEGPHCGSASIPCYCLLSRGQSCAGFLRVSGLIAHHTHVLCSSTSYIRSHPFVQNASSSTCWNASRLLSSPSCGLSVSGFWASRQLSVSGQLLCLGMNCPELRSIKSVQHVSELSLVSPQLRVRT